MRKMVMRFTRLMGRSTRYVRTNGILQLQQTCLQHKLTHILPAVRPKPLPLRQTLPRHQVRLLRRLLLPLLPPGATPLALPAKQQRRPSNTTTPEPSRRLLQQRENELGQQQPRLTPRLPALAAQRAGSNAHGRLVRPRPARGKIRWAGETAQREGSEGISGVLVQGSGAVHCGGACEEDGERQVYQ